MSIFMLLLIIVIVRLTTNIPFNVLILNLGGRDQITATTSTSTEPITASAATVVSSAAPVQQQYKPNEVSSSPIVKNEAPVIQKSSPVVEPIVKVTPSNSARRNEVPVEEYEAPRKIYSSNTNPRKRAYNSSSIQPEENTNSDQGNTNTSSEQTNGNSPYSYNRSSAYSQKSRTLSSNASKSNSSKTVVSKKYNSNSSRYFSQSEMNEFIRQYPNRSTYIHFVNFGSADNEMEGVRSQIIGMLNSNGYYEIDKYWFVYNGYTEIKEVHFGVNGNTAVNFYIPPSKQ